MNVSSIIIRPLEKSDMFDVIELLQLLSNFKPSKKNYNKIWHDFKSQNNVHSLVAIIDNKIVGYGSIVIETKIRGGRKGHIEDIVTHQNFRKKQIGSKIICNLFKIAKKKECYKISLECNKDNIPFYINNNFEISGTGMQQFL
ncbi:GNAT family N-acetyltransferase [Alphaproteobacteria bacterium]|nr:GNAT family N-acetyltransferase [Alphaproteobacteria bacterium]